MGTFFLVVVCVVAVVLLLQYFRKHGPKNRVDETGWNVEERDALRVLDRRLADGDISQKEYDELKRRIINKS